MKKGYIFSWYNSGRNYGQTLQAYALQWSLRNMGYDVEHVCFDTNRSIKKSLLIKLKDFMHLTKSQRRVQNKFDLFILDNMRVTKRLADDVQVQKFIAQNRPNFLVCGSDQIWNPYSVHPFYYLEGIGNEQTNRIAYAVSTCDKRRMDKFCEHPEIKEWIEQINYVYVRENSGKIILSELFSVESKVVLDPTLLLSGEKWVKNLCLNKKDSNYVLCYAFNLTDKQRAMILKRAGVLNAEIKYGNILEGDVGGQEEWSPIEFLENILNAREVFTDSFHGTVFSILFHKDFVIFDNGNELGSDPYYNIDRMSTLLSIIGLENRLVYGEEIPQMEKIDYKEIDEVLEKRRKECLSLLQRSIEC